MCLTLGDMDGSLPGSSVLGFPRQEYWSGLPFPSPGDLPNPAVEPASPALAGGFFTTVPPGKLSPGTHFRSICLIGTSFLAGFPWVYSVALEKAMAPHSSTLAWKIPWMEKSGGLQSMGSLRVTTE